MRTLIVALVTALSVLVAAPAAAHADCVTLAEYRSIHTAFDLTGDTPAAVYAKTGVRGQIISNTWSQIGNVRYHYQARTYRECRGGTAGVAFKGSLRLHAYFKTF
jgi:rhodanese-related sulfurtransferase